MAKETTGKMTFDEALKILKGDIYLCPLSQLQEAMRIVREQDPTNPALKDALNALKSFETENNLTEDSAKVYADNYKKMEENTADLTFEEFRAKNKDIADILDRVEIIDGKGDQEKIVDDKTKNEYLSLLFDGAKMKAEAILAGNKDFANMSKTERNNILKDEIKTIFFADFAQTTIASSLDKPTKEEQVIGSPEYRDFVNRQSKKATEVFGSILQGKEKIKMTVDSILSCCAETAVQIERYISALQRKAQTFVNQAVDKAKAAGKTVESEFSKLAASLQRKKNKFEELANHISKNRYEIWKIIKGSFSDNKFKLIGNVAANAAFGYWTAAAAAGAAGAAAAPVLVPAIAAYAAYHTAGAWVYPIIAEMRRINRKKKEKGETPLKFMDALKQAWKNKMNSRKDKRSYIIGGVLNTGLAVAGFAWLKDGLEAADAANTLVGGAKDGLNVSLASNIAETRHAISLGRAGTATVAQLTDASIAYAVAVKDPDNKEKSTEFKQAATSALIGLGFNVVFQELGFSRGQSNAEAAVSSDAPVNVETPEKQNRGSWLGRLFGVKDSTATDTTVVQAQGGSTVASQANVVSDASAENTDGGLFPRTYTSREEMGISRREYNILVQTTEGTLKSATGDEVTLDRVYRNLEGSMDQFPGKTKEEIIYKFNRLYAFMRKAYEVGDGTLRETPSGHDYLEKRFDRLDLGLNEDQMRNLVSFAEENTYAGKGEIKNGLKELFPNEFDNKETSSIITIIHSNQRFYQYQQEMEALIGLLGCGNKISAQQALAVNNMLDKTDAILATGTENTQLTGLSLAKDCHDDDGQWRRIDRPEPETEPTPEPEPEP